MTSKINFWYTSVSRGIAGANFNLIPFLDSEIYGDVEPEAT